MRLQHSSRCNIPSIDARVDGTRRALSRAQSLSDVPMIGCQYLLQADEPGNQRGNDEQYHHAHSRSGSPVTGGTSRLPIAPPDIRVEIGNHRSMSHIVSVRAGALHRCSRVHM